MSFRYVQKCVLPFSYSPQHYSSTVPSIMVALQSPLLLPIALFLLLTHRLCGVDLSCCHEERGEVQNGVGACCCWLVGFDRSLDQSLQTGQKPVTNERKGSTGNDMEAVIRALDCALRENTRERPIPRAADLNLDTVFEPAIFPNTRTTTTLCASSDSS